MAREVTNEICGMDRAKYGAIKYMAFDSPEEYAAFLRTIPERWHLRPYDSWSGNGTAHNIPILEQGSLANLAKAQAIIDKIDVRDFLADNMPLLETAMAGFVPNVAAYLAGQPETMFDLVESEQQSPITPIRIFVDTCTSAYVSPETLTKRGVAVLAFAMIMNTIRPVEVHVASLVKSGYSSIKCTGTTVRISTAPLDLGRAIYMLTDPGYARGLHFAASGFISNEDIGSGPWQFGVDPSKPEKYDALNRQVLMLNDNDIYLRGGHAFDTLMLNDPIAWVNKLVQETAAKGR